jgi:hypothetical protein
MNIVVDKVVQAEQFAEIHSAHTHVRYKAREHSTLLINSNG